MATPRQVVLFGGALLLAWAGLASIAAAQSPAAPPAADYAAGKRLVQWKCNACHRSLRATESRKTRAEWEVTVHRMVGNGLDAKDEEIEAIIQYLVSLNVPKDAP